MVRAGETGGVLDRVLSQLADIIEKQVELKRKVKKAHMPKEARKAAEREVKRLSKMHPSASEYMVSRTYLDWLISLPWAKATTDVIDIPAEQTLLT